MKTIKFDYGHPLTNLIVELEVRVGVFCEKCHYRDKCFDDVSYHPEEIGKCKKLPKLYKLYWQAKSKSISAIAPLTIYQEEE